MLSVATVCAGLIDLTFFSHSVSCCTSWQLDTSRFIVTSNLEYFSGKAEALSVLSMRRVIEEAVSNLRAQPAQTEK
jgi:hypothetical protein